MAQIITLLYLLSKFFPHQQRWTSACTPWCSILHCPGQSLATLGLLTHGQGGSVLPFSPTQHPQLTRSQGKDSSTDPKSPFVHLIYPGSLQNTGPHTWGCRAETSACFSMGGSQRQALGSGAQGAMLVPVPALGGPRKLCPRSGRYRINI